MLNMQQRKGAENLQLVSQYKISKHRNCKQMWKTNKTKIIQIQIPIETNLKIKTKISKKNDEYLTRIQTNTNENMKLKTQIEYLQLHSCQDMITFMIFVTVIKYYQTKHDST